MTAIDFSSQVFALGKGDWLVRFGAVSVNPNDSSSQVGTIASSSVSVDGSQGVFVNLT